MKQHEQQCSDENYQCHVCGSNHWTKSSYYWHMEAKHSGGEFYCDLCNDGKNYKLKVSIRRHMRRSHHNNEEQKKKKKQPEPPTIEHFQMEWLRTTEERMRQQNCVVTAGERVVPDKSVDPSPSKTCLTCDKEFPTERQLTHHMRRHDQSKWKPCPICNKSYFGLSRHMNSHYKVKNHVCDVCGAAYGQWSSLKEHKAMNHQPDGEFFCDICSNGRVYRSRSSLRQHLTVHAKNILRRSGSLVTERKRLDFECKLCDQKFPSRYTLISHNSLKHTENAPVFRCKLCGKGFRLKT